MQARILGLFASLCTIGLTSLTYAHDTPQLVAEVEVQSTSVVWHPLVSFEQAHLTVTYPTEETVEHTFAGDSTPVWHAVEHLPFGTYRYTLTLLRATDDKPKRQRRTVQTGAFTNRTSGLSRPEEPPSALRDHVIADDLIVKLNLCVGAGCIDGEAFGFDTIRMHENSVRWWFEDTSTAAGDPSNDWRIVINDVGNDFESERTSGTREYFAIEDHDLSRFLFLIEAGAPTSALYVESSGDVGFGTNTPDEILHLPSSSRSAIKFEHVGTSDITLFTESNGLRSNRDFTASDRPLRIHDTGSSTDLARIHGDGRFVISGSLAKASGSFKIDHPLDPENRYLYHSFVESPDMMNVYNGNITTDAEGYATVTLPDYFETLNMDFRYQLTAIGTFADAIVAQEIERNQFVVRTTEPNVKVSWQVTGVRQDPWAQQHRIQVEQAKPLAKRGSTLYPTNTLPRDQ